MDKVIQWNQFKIKNTFGASPWVKKVILIVLENTLLVFEAIGGITIELFWLTLSDDFQSIVFNSFYISCHAS